MARWVIFNFYDGEFIRQNDAIIVFETKGLARQFLERYRKPKPLQITKDVTVNYSYYDAPFRFVKEEDYEAL
ncbi:hypothetical protein [Streptococcus hyointestinalis]|uniref:hypothetical protein n=1 Tax=Streptococcus hyointestinalis TaxID=1337 RepID=UPI0013DF6C30|nr:hypothetical protein [Streptococcus hyointestinalis]